MPSSVNVQRDERVELSFNTQIILEKAPLLFADFGAAVAGWSWAEQYYQNIRAILELNDGDLTFSEFKEPRLSSQQRRMLLSAAEKHLSGQPLSLFLDAFELAVSPATERNQLAHGLIGYWDARPNNLLVYQQADFQRLFRKTFAPTIFTGRIDVEDAELDAAMMAALNSGQLYDHTDFARLQKQMEASSEIFIALANMCSSDKSVAALGQRMLLARPDVQSHIEKEK